MELALAGKRALVTGGSRGIGEAIARVLCSEGCRVVINGRDTEQGTRTASSIGELASFVAADVTIPGNCDPLVREACSRLGGLDILVCSVGSGRSVPAGTETREEWYRMLDLNLLSTASMVSAARPELSASKGAIACISSICSLERLGAPATYAVAKAALNVFVRELAMPLGKEGIRINAIAPGNILFRGSVWERKIEEQRDVVEKMLSNEVPLSRFGRAEEVADLCAFLVSPRASFMTGSIHVIDGGQVRG